MFIRTVKLKDFPWNGWLALGVDGAPTAAWNPIGGLNDRFGRLMWFAVGDPALIPSPYEAGWMLNRIPISRRIHHDVRTGNTVISRPGVPRRSCARAVTRVGS